MTHALLALALAASPGGALPPGSRLVEVNGVALHVRTLGAGNPGPAVVLLSGPTDHWHADSGWFALLQPLLARGFRVHAVDRAGHAFSAIAADGSYARFGADLAALLPRLEPEPVVVVAFASANLALHHLFALGGAGRVRAALLVDPDALHPDLLAFYGDQAKPFQDAERLRAYVEAGKYDARARGFLDEERAHVEAILPAADAGAMDWAFYDAVAGQRLERARILARFAETARYGDDVRTAAAVPWPAAVPVWTHDTDFEASALEKATEPAEREALARWRDRSAEFARGLPGGCRLASPAREHLAPIAEAGRLVEQVGRLARGEPCPAPPPVSGG